MKHQLTDDSDHFTHYDYLLQLIENGQMTTFKDHLKEINNEALIKFLSVNPKWNDCEKIIHDEILKRMN